MADAPPIVAASADGVLHQFPAGTDPSVVDGVMKQYAAERAPKEEPKPPEESGPIDLGAMGRKAGQTLVGGAGETVTGVGAIAKGVGQSEVGQTSTDLDMMHAIDDGSDFGKLMKAAPNDLARVALRQYQLADADQRAEMKQAAINKMAAPPSQVELSGEHMMKAGEGITEAGKQAFPVTPAEEQRPDVMITGMVAGIAKYIGAHGVGGMPALIGMAGVDAYGKTYNDAKTAGATDEDATIAATGSGLAQGGLMALPVGQFTKAFDLVPIPLKSKMLGAVVEAVKGGATLTAFSQLSTIADNVVAKNTYDPNRPVTQGVGENLPETFAAGAILPLVGAGANRLFRGRDAVPSPEPVLKEPTLEGAIAKANQVSEGAPADVGAMAVQAKEFGNEGEKQQAKLLQLFQGLNEGEIHPTQDGGFAYHVGEEQIPLKVWDEKAAKPAAESQDGETGGEEGAVLPTTISPALAAAQRAHYGKLGIDVVYFENDPRIPFDGAVDPQNPDTIYLSNDPQRNATQVAAHEVTHVLEATTLPDGTRLADVLHGQIARGLTQAGLQHGIDVFGKGAPQRTAFPEGQEGNAAHADAYMRHLIGEIGADIGGEAPKFQTFLPKVVNEVQARYGDDAAKSVVQKLIAGFQQAYRTLREFFFKPEEMAEYGQPETQSQHWVTNLGEIHDTLAKMYAERFGTQAEKTNAALRDMKDKAQRDRLLKAPETPPGGAAEAAGAQGAEKAPEGQPKPGAAPGGRETPPAAYEVSRQKAATYKRWLGEMQGGNPRDIEKVRKAYQAERQRMADILATMPAEQVGGTGPQRQLNAPALVTPAPRPAVTPENVYQPKTHGVEPGPAPTAPTPEAAPVAAAAPAAPGAPSAAFAEKIRTEKERVWADRSIMGATHRGVTRNEQFATDVARERVMREEASAQIEEAIERGIPADAMEAIARFYRPVEGETVPAAFDKAVDRWITIEEAKAAHHFGDEDVATYDMLEKEGQSDPVLAEVFRLLNEHYEGHVEKELPGDEDIPLGTGEAAAPEGAREETPRAEVGRPGGEEAGGEPGRGGEVPSHEGGPLGPQFSPKEREERIDLSPGGGGKSAKFGNTTIDYGVARDGKSAEVILVKTPREQRGEGSARRAMEQFLHETDAKGLTVFLSADPMDRGVSKGRLVDFYKSLGFIENRGRNKDFSSTAGMVREAQGGPRFSPRETPLLNTPKATPEELAARQHQRDKEEAEARMRGRKGGKVPQESADETPLFGGPRQSTLFSPKQTREPVPSEEYEKARLAHDAASREYNKIVLDYRARRVDDAEFLAAQDKYKAAGKLFDAAYEKEAAREPEPEAPEEDRQGRLFSPRITDESRRKDKAYEDARPVYAALGRAPETQTIAQRWEKFKDQLGKRMLIATVDKYLQTKSIDPMAYMAQRNFNSSSGALEVLLTKGTLKLNGSAFDFAQRNGGVETQVIRPLHGEHGDWAWWVAANRAERLSAEDREHLFTPEQIATLKKTNQGELDFDYEIPNGKTTRSREAAFMDTLRKYDEFNKNVMGLGVKAGLFKQETVDKLWANPFYVPFFRVAEKEGAAPFTGGQKTGGFAKQYGFKTLTGGTGKLHNDLWQNVIGNWGHLIDAAGKNIGANQVLDAAERTGVAGKVTQQQYDHQMTKADRDNTTWTMVDGKKQNWHISDPLLFDAVSAIHSANFTDPFSKAANFFSRTLRMGVTSDPGFMLRVTIKDSEQAVATAPMSYNVLGNIVKGYRMTDLPGALRNVARAAVGMHEEALRESDELVSVMAGGGLMRLGAGHAGGFRKTTAEAMSGEDLSWADGFRYMKRAARQVKEVLAQSEDINRAALYSELIKRGVPHDEATFAARDLEDFTLSGAAPWVRWIAHAVTFLNAGAQGLYKVGRSAADADRNVTAAVGGKVAWAASMRVAKVMTATVLATLALDYIYRNNEDYKKRAEYDRNGKWWFHVGKYQFQIPMGFELAGLSRIATNALDMFFDKEMTGRRWANNALSIVGQNMFMNPTPQVIAPLVDVRTNTTGTGQPIEPKGMENLRPEEKFSSQNTLAARGVSTVGNKIARGIGGPTAEFSSPMQLDYLWNGYTGWLGSAILGSADRVARQFTHEPARPAADLWNVATRGVVSQGPTPQSRYIDTMYQQAEAADKAYGTYEDLIKRQQFQKAQDFYKENADLINRRGLVDAVVRSEGSLNQQVRLIQNNPNPQVTGEQKRLMIQQLQAIRNKTAESVFGAH